MRTTSGADALYANDRPPDDATFVARLREAGAIILAKANMGEYAPAARAARSAARSAIRTTPSATPGASSARLGHRPWRRIS